ncbi:hypothetical protein K7472_02155 [Streptomyces sp. PTM05]|uniref:Uncharacterized protein n=1 Tax=Streptantibioticus parmotrematis TaxID=2873249 RepID=A0ABS7QMM4_9ACTN|nr:hypothetical protein [Streptantibioticus parmotrematis]MBY8883650.1 hypothetical protein [Streptantibioticus parmotrematis]
MHQRLLRARRTAVAGAVLVTVAGTVVAGAPAARAATVTHCPTAHSAPLLPTGTGYLFPFIVTSVSACGFVDHGAPYDFTVDTATSTVYGPPGGPYTYTVDNLSLACTAVKVTGDSLLATGCSPG